MKLIAHLYIGTNRFVLEDMKNGIYKDIVFASDNMETFSHYCEGTVILITVELDTDLMMKVPDDHVFGTDYTWGYNEMTYPERANWFSFSSKYLKDHLKDIYNMPKDLINPILDYYRELDS